MPTAGSSARPQVPRALADVGHLLRFRAAAVRRRSAFGWVAAAFLGLTAAAAVVPAYVPGAAGDGRAFDLRLLLPTGFAGFLALAVVSAVASGGGRELIPRDQAVAYPVSPTTDHLGALLLAPLNIAWLIQGWVLLGTTAFVLGPHGLAAAQLVVLVWLAAATAVAQVLAWTVEAVWRRDHGVAIVRVLSGLLLAAALVLQLSGHLTGLFDRAPTVWLVIGAFDGGSLRWFLTVAVELGLLVAAVALGAVPARAAARRAPRDEQGTENDVHPPRPVSRSALAALVRLDRASVWRAVPMRRGMVVLAIGPGLVAMLGDLPWTTMTVLPGLVASGGALLFGVNVWCLDGRGALWRENLPVAAGLVFAARAIVLAEFLMVASAITIGLASLRAGVPAPQEATALLATGLVVIVQVVAASMRWSARRPYAVDLRSARATPAPPLVMVGYATRLAVSTTVTGLVFSGLSHLPDWRISPVAAVPFLAWSLWRLLRARRRWLDPVGRASVVTAVTA